MSLLSNQTREAPICETKVMDLTFSKVTQCTHLLFIQGPARVTEYGH